MRWKNIEGYESIYMISDSGLVKSLPREVNHSIPGVTKRIRGRILKNAYSRGYQFVGLHRNGKIEQRYVHRILATAFIGEIGDKEINHKNGIKHDNRLENIEIVSSSENMKHSYRVLGRSSPKGMLGKFGKEHHLSRPVVQKDFSGNIIKVFESIRRAGIFGFDSGAISKCCKGKMKQYKHFKWSYYEN